MSLDLIKRIGLEELKALAAAGTLEGAFEGIPIEEYHAIKNFVSSSSLSEAERSPAHFQAYLAQDFNPSDTLLMGTAIHECVLEPDTFLERNVLGPEVATRASAEWKSFVKTNPGKVVWRPQDWERITKTAENIVGHPKIGPFLHNARREVSIFWRDKDTGVLCRVRPDLLFEDGLCPDIKSTENAGPSEFARSIDSYHYHMRLAFYMDGIEAVLGIKPPSACLIAAEKSPPYAVQPYVLEPDPQYGIDPIEIGRQRYKAVLAKIAACQKSGEWPAYSDEFMGISLPDWRNRQIHFAESGEVA